MFIEVKERFQDKVRCTNEEFRHDPFEIIRRPVIIFVVFDAEIEKWNIFLMEFPMVGGHGPVVGVGGFRFFMPKRNG